MKKGKIYFVWDGDKSISFWMLGRCTDDNASESEGSDLRNHANYFSSDLFYRKDSLWCYQCTGRNFREATDAEIEHFEECERLGKYTAPPPKPEVNNNYSII